LVFFLTYFIYNLIATAINATAKINICFLSMMFSFYFSYQVDRIIVQIYNLFRRLNDSLKRVFEKLSINLHCTGNGLITDSHIYLC
jgi:predicted PurR-regulated permease PerM